MLDKNIQSNLLEELSTEQEELIAGGKSGYSSDRDVAWFPVPVPVPVPPPPLPLPYPYPHNR
ncbi:hypothetical protein ACSQ6I_06715 [Anabaena sp. WFMT]|uniref:hypothetical protein n=1 Tax=Anabaena sp. WFMT TaxID=3449730 RepID=UPI003F206C93